MPRELWLQLWRFFLLLGYQSLLFVGWPWVFDESIGIECLLKVLASVIGMNREEKSDEKERNENELPPREVKRTHHES